MALRYQQQERQQQRYKRCREDEHQLEEDTSKRRDHFQAADPDAAAEPETSVSLASVSKTVLAPYKCPVPGYSGPLGCRGTLGVKRKMQDLYYRYQPSRSYGNCDDADDGDDDGDDDERRRQLAQYGEASEATTVAGGCSRGPPTLFRPIEFEEGDDDGDRTAASPMAATATSTRRPAPAAAVAPPPPPRNRGPQIIPQLRRSSSKVVRVGGLAEAAAALATGGAIAPPPLPAPLLVNTPPPLTSETGEPLTTGLREMEDFLSSLTAAAAVPVPPPPPPPLPQLATGPTAPTQDLLGSRRSLRQARLPLRSPDTADAAATAAVVDVTMGLRQHGGAAVDGAAVEAAGAAVGSMDTGTHFRPPSPVQPSSPPPRFVLAASPAAASPFPGPAGDRSATTPLAETAETLGFCSPAAAAAALRRPLTFDARVGLSGLPSPSPSAAESLRHADGDGGPRSDDGGSQASAASWPVATEPPGDPPTDAVQPLNAAAAAGAATEDHDTTEQITGCGGSDDVPAARSAPPPPGSPIRMVCEDAQGATKRALDKPSEQKHEHVTMSRSPSRSKGSIADEGHSGGSDGKSGGGGGDSRTVAPAAVVADDDAAADAYGQEVPFGSGGDGEDGGDGDAVRSRSTIMLAGRRVLQPPSLGMEDRGGGGGGGAAVASVAVIRGRQDGLLSRQDDAGGESSALPPAEAAAEAPSLAVVSGTAAADGGGTSLLGLHAAEVPTAGVANIRKYGESGHGGDGGGDESDGGSGAAAASTEREVAAGAEEQLVSEPYTASLAWSRNLYHYPPDAASSISLRHARLFFAVSALRDSETPLASPVSGAPLASLSTAGEPQHRWRASAPLASPRRGSSSSDEDGLHLCTDLEDDVLDQQQKALRTSPETSVSQEHNNENESPQQQQQQKQKKQGGAHGSNSVVRGARQHQQQHQHLHHQHASKAAAANKSQTGAVGSTTDTHQNCGRSSSGSGSRRAGSCLGLMGRRPLGLLLSPSPPAGGAHAGHQGGERGAPLNTKPQPYKCPVPNYRGQLGARGTLGMKRAPLAPLQQLMGQLKTVISPERGNTRMRHKPIQRTSNDSQTLMWRRHL
ncbi:hypothetical protein VOLCADRAFT_107786 [Volvox carteri f. nagariensis]|uniref:Uncharacterized protein n=1 Tax=Volvox carteri f. nagariensis TaxID=3068 RepID=D8UGC8_VOLCA|nr:uncharacterized protein VOLCADRAFT_107786 [Volvox carteri f. nagariensis]EFJ41267.1 hypothetical protein VOLCADRAFT_107786 [Volvox carteri f. nagariensis]|eukprot:XP_002957718.1 hypothetical protein VOLCADRAFT_107786 [Volvox carteri f. nagariensis]